MNKTLIEGVEKLLDMENPTTRANHAGWDKGDCSDVGMVRILMIQTIEEEIEDRGEYYDGCYDKLLHSLMNEYSS